MRKYKKKNRICVVSVDVEEDLNQKTFHGVENLDKVLKVFKQFNIRATLFVTGEVLELYYDKVIKWSKNHEIACHGYYHVPLYKLSISERRDQLRKFNQLYEDILGTKPKGFRAVQLIIDTFQLKLLEDLGFVYDSSVVPQRCLFRKRPSYLGKAPSEPYHPSYDNHLVKGTMKILEIPVSRLLFGIPLQGTWIRLIGVKPYRLLLALKKPNFISLTMHSWDCIRYKGPYSKNSGDNFLVMLKEVLKMLSNYYNFQSCLDVALTVLKKS